MLRPIATLAVDAGMAYRVPDRMAPDTQPHQLPNRPWDHARHRYPHSHIASVRQDKPPRICTAAAIIARGEVLSNCLSKCRSHMSKFIVTQILPRPHSPLRMQCTHCALQKT